ncbi:MAG: O-antigen/teichoic acid export membrane protein [Verrucomicrobiales bacterium]|jgi:O-antigen/teichoic acid export membrane protein
MEWKKRFAATTITSYVQMGLRMVTGLAIFRTMFGSWSSVEFGFWAFLWSVLAFGILLDFGLGMTIQKTVASRTENDDIDGVNRVVSTIFWTFAGIGMLIFVLAILCRPLLFQAIDVPVDMADRFTPAYFYFFIAIALTFPLGIYGEVLAGIQRVDIFNIIQIVSTVANTIAVLSLLYLGSGVEHVMLAACSVLLATNIACALCAHRLAKGLSIRFRFFDFSEVGSRIKFSIAAYLVVFSGIVLTKTDQAVIAGVLGLGSVALYQAAAKVSEILNMLATQSENLISPAAANLHARGNRRGLIDLLLKNSRFLFTITTPCYILAAFFLKDLICLLTGEEILPEGAFLTGQLLLLAIYIGTVTSSCGRRVMVMCGMENLLLKFSLTQAAVNLILSVVLARAWGVPGVAAATLITSTLFGFGVFLPTLKRFSEISATEYIQYHFRGNMLGLAVMAIVLAGILTILPSHSSTLGFLDLIWRGALVALSYMACNFRQIRATWAPEAPDGHA